ncbi:MAG: redoxin family protein [Gemmataceae bacterium]
MIELGQLEKRHAEIEKNGLQVIVASVEGPDLAKQTQADFPHLRVVSDETKSLTNAIGGLHVGAAPDGGDAAAPTTFHIDTAGRVKWYFRPSRHLNRLSPDELLKAATQS